MIIGLQTIKGFNIEDILDKAITLGFRAFEIFFDGYYCSELPQAFRTQLKERINEHDLFLTVHAPIIKTLNQETIQMIYDHLAFAHSMDAHIFTLHPIYPLKIFSLFLKTVLKEANKSAPSVRIGIENIPMSTASELNNLFSQLDMIQNVGLTFDIGHAQLTSNALEYLNALRMPIVECHLHTNDGKCDSHLDIRDERGIIPIRRILKTIFLEKDFKGPYILEYWREEMDQTKDWLAHTFNEFSEFD